MEVLEGVIEVDGIIVFITCGMMAVILAYVTFRRGYDRGYRDGYTMRDALLLWEKMKNEKGISKKV